MPLDPCLIAGRRRVLCNAALSSHPRQASRAVPWCRSRASAPSALGISIPYPGTRSTLRELARGRAYSSSPLHPSRTDAQAEVQRGKHEIETATSQALNELAKTSANLAVDLAGRIVGSKLTASDHAKLIEESLARFPQGDHRQN